MGNSYVYSESVEREDINTSDLHNEGIIIDIRSH